MTNEYNEIWALWPDGYMCEFDDIEERLMNGSSDDYYLVTVYSFHSDGTPKTWVRRL